MKKILLLILLLIPLNSFAYDLSDPTASANIANNLPSNVVTQDYQLAVNLEDNLSVATVLIGDTVGSPSGSYLLDVRSGTSASFKVDAQAPNGQSSYDLYGRDGSGNTVRIQTSAIGAGTTRGLLGTVTNHPLYLMTNDIPVFYIDTAQEVGIGTATPTEKLEVVGSIEIPTANYIVLGAAVIDGSWRFKVSGNTFIHERRESGSWVIKQTISP